MCRNMSKVRIGVIGVGTMGLHHASYMKDVEGAQLTAICDTDPTRLETARGRVPNVTPFDNYQDLLSSGSVDAVLIATPHYPHPEITLAAFEKNLHVLCEKPVAVTVGAARRMNEAAAKHPKLKFAAMFMMRTSG